MGSPARRLRRRCIFSRERLTTTSMSHSNTVKGRLPLGEPKICTEEVTIVSLADAPGEKQAWNRSRATIYVWALVEWLVVTNALQISSRLRIAALRKFGANIGNGVIFRPRTRVKFPWKLHIGDNAWIGEGVWFHNQDDIYIGNDVVISQESLLTTGSHAYRTDMALITRPIVIEDGVWVTSRVIVLGGAKIGTSSVIAPGSIVRGNVPPNRVIDRSNDLGRRFN